MPSTGSPTPSLSTSQRQLTPEHRAPRALRIATGVVAVAAALATVALLLSDRAPGLIDATFGDAAHRLWERIDADQRAAISATGATGEPDLFVHVAIWFVVTLLVACAIWTWRGIALAGATAAVASVVLELGQRRWATTRAFELSDMVANFVGVALGVATACGVLWSWDRAARLLSRWRSRRDPV